MFLTIYFDGQFWIGLIECVDDAHPCAPRLRVARHVFGSEPRDIEVLEFVQHHLLDVASRATAEVEIECKIKAIHNPK